MYCPKARGGLGLWKPPDLPDEGSRFMERRATRSGRAWKGAVKGTECLRLVSAWVLVGRASEKSAPQCVGYLGRHSSAINGFAAAPACQCSSRHNARWPRPGGTKNGGRTRVCAGYPLALLSEGFVAIVEKGLRQQPDIHARA